MNRRGFFGLLAAVALLPKSVVGKAHRAGFMIPRGRCLGKFHHNWRAVKVIRTVNEDIFGGTRVLEASWEDVYSTNLPYGFRRAIGRKIRTTIHLSKGRYRHICRWTEQIT